MKPSASINPAISIVTRLCLAAALMLTSLGATPPRAETTRAVPLAKPTPTPATHGAPRDIALNYFRGQGQAQGFAPADLIDLIVTDKVPTRHNGVTHVYLRQQVNGLEVSNAVANANVTRDGTILSAHHTFVPDAAAQATEALAVRSLSASQAVARAAEQLGLPTPTLTVRQSLGGKSQAAHLTGGGISQDDIPVKLVYYAVKGKTLRLAWDMVIYPTGGEHWWNVQVDAETGVILGKADWVASETYNVVPFPAESPDHGPVAIAVNPYLSNTVASPYGWHDTDGQAGPEYTTTRGNNVSAQEDWLGDNDTTPGLQPDAGSSLLFTPTINFSVHPTQYVTSAMVSLFYWNNIIHDLLYNYGFDEASGNFQDNTYGRGGTGGDPVQADAQDAFDVGRRNNANFGTPPDGTSGRMQMFVWEGDNASKQVVVHAPPAIAGSYMAGDAEFGAQVALVTATVKLANDGVLTTTDGCDTFGAGFFTGQIALIDRGSCNFTVKALNAQNAGALGVIIADNRVDPVPPEMFGIDPSITLPVVSILQADGVTFKANLPITATLVLPPPATPRDSDFDAGIILHEYGHGVSNRLTGGPSAAGCLGTTESGGMGEGWSDFLALAFLAQPGDTGPQARGMGTYALFQPTTGSGIRSYPYSTDLGVNPLTYGSMPTTGNRVHAIGEIWATTLWDLHWAYVNRYGFSADMYNGTAGNNQAIRLVLDGMKFQPCNPSFIDARNALLDADVASTGGRDQALIWQVFARRGLGFNANSGDLEDENDGVADFSLPPALGFKLDRPPTLGYPGQTFTYTLVARNQGEVILNNTVLTAQVPVSATYVAGSASQGGVEATGLIQWNVGTVLTSTYLTRTFQMRLPEALNLQHRFLSDSPLSWATTQIGAPGWSFVTDQGRQVWYASEPDTPSEQALALTTPVTIPVGGLLKLNHRYNSEYSYDGGVIEISTDNGATWTDLGPQMTRNGYNTEADDGGSFIPAFGGSSGGYLQTEIDLSSFAGQVVLFRFRFFSDTGTSGEGWYVDADYMLFGPPQPELTVLAGAEASGNLSVTVSAPLLVPSTAVAQYRPLPRVMTIAPGQTALTATLSLTNVGGLPLGFNLSGLPTWLTVSPLSGVVPSQGQLPLTLVWDTSAFTVGVTYTGTLTLNSNNFGAPSLQIPLSSVFIGGAATVGPSVNPPLVFTNANGVTTTVEFPTDAVSNSVTVLYRHFLTPVTSTGGLNFAGHAFTLGVLSGTETLETFTFAQPITVTIHYAEAEAAGVFAPGLTLYLWDGNQWVDAATSCPAPRPYVRDIVQRTVSVSICHFTPFALLGPSQQNLYLPLVQR